MKNLLFLAISALILVSCTEKTNFSVHVTIKGLKKGTVYLEKGDSINQFVTIDSIYINDGNETFTFSKNINEPEIFFLSLNKANTKQIQFFGEPGVTTIHTTLNKFIEKAKITGSENQKLLQQHDDYTQKFRFENLDLFKEKVEAQISNDTKKLEEINNKYNQNLKRMYLFSTNYAINNKDKAIAPYIALSKMDRATPKLKNTIYEALTTEVKNSKYGLMLKEELAN